MPTIPSRPDAPGRITPIVSKLKDAPDHSLREFDAPIESPIARRRVPWGGLIKFVVFAALALGAYEAYEHYELVKSYLPVEKIESFFRTPPKTVGPRIIPVGTANVRKGNVNIYLNGLGTVTAFYTVTVRTRIDGELVNVAFTEGQLVHQGDLLAEIDPRPYQVQLTQAEGQLVKDQASLKVAKLDMERYVALLASRSVTAQQIDAQRALIQQSEGAIQTDQGMIDNVRLQLAYCHITSPISGRIGLRLVDPGNMVHASDTNGLAVVTQLQPIAVVFTIPQDDIQKVQAKMNAGEELIVDAFDRQFDAKLASGKMLATDNQVDAMTGTLRLKAIFDNKDSMLFPNQFVNARLQIEMIVDATIVPTAAVQRGPTSNFVYVVKSDDTVELRTVEVGPSESDQTVIESGLEPGEVVVTDGVDKLNHGAKVKQRDASAGESSAEGASSNDASSGPAHAKGPARAKDR